MHFALRRALQLTGCQTQCHRAAWQPQSPNQNEGHDPNIVPGSKHCRAGAYSLHAVERDLLFPSVWNYWKRLKQKTSLPCSRSLYSRNKCGGGRIILSFCSLAIKINSIHQIWRMEKQKHSCSVLKPVLCIWECLWKHGSTAVENVYVELQLRGKRISCLLEAQFQLINCALGKRLCEKFSETRIRFWGLG